uniref:Putative nucleolar transcription factor 1-like agrilus planipennis n=1 Tax=Xenopsylla cheopis TaxID=163159 RepID=A0A6M2DRP2_XENCH
MGQKKHSLSTNDALNSSKSSKHSKKKSKNKSDHEQSFTTPTKPAKSSKKDKTPKSAKHKDKSLSKQIEDDVILSDEEVFEKKTKTKSKKDKKNKSIEVQEDEEVQEEVMASEFWPEEDLNELFTQIESVLPKVDNVQFKTRVDGLPWEKIAFKTYSAQDCRLMWDSIQKRLRCYRILQELIDEAKVWSKTPWVDFHKKNKEHPERPLKPLGIYVLYFKHVYEKTRLRHPNESTKELTRRISQKYRKLSEEKRAKFAALAKEGREKYERDLEQFFLKYPNQRPKRGRSKSPMKKPVAITEKAKPANSDSDSDSDSDKNKDVNVNVNVTKKKKDVKTQDATKPQVPFRLFLNDKLSKESKDVDKMAFQARCRELWTKMSDEEKGVWIDKTVELEDKYKQKLGAESNTFKSCLSKDEITIRERLLGKPDKPPNSTYSLFSTMLLSSDELKTAAPKDRTFLIAQQWRNLEPDEKKTYEDRVTNLKEVYKNKYAKYLNSLSPSKRNVEIDKKKTKPKTKIKEVDDEVEAVKEPKRKKK